VKPFDEMSPKEALTGTNKKGKKQNTFTSAIQKDKQIQEQSTKQADGKISFAYKEEEANENTPIQPVKCKYQC